MHYVISDIHGCYSQYINLISEINLKPDDTLYILGDIVDRGPEPMKIWKRHMYLNIRKLKSPVYI